GRGQGEAAAKAGFEQPEVASAGIPGTAGKGFPDGLAPEGPDRDDAGLTPLATLDHALERLQPVEVVAVQSSVADADRFGDLRPVGDVDRRQAPGHRQRRAGHERATHPSRRLHHLPGPRPVPGQMLIIEDRYGTAAPPENRDNLLEELIARV